MSRVIGILLVVLAALAAPASPAAALRLSDHTRTASATAGADAALGTGHERRDPAASAPVILVFGDSLSAGYGVPLGHGWVSLLGQRMAGEGYDFEVVNASVSGETTAGGLARLPRALALHRPRLVILELGANDGLRGLPLAQAQVNLTRMVELAQAEGAQVLLIGMRMPPNYGPRYTSEFHAMYTSLAHSYHLALVPFLMAGVALRPDLIQADGLHPNEQAQPLLLDNVWPELQGLLGPPRQGRAQERR